MRDRNPPQHRTAIIDTHDRIEAALKSKPGLAPGFRLLEMLTGKSGLKCCSSNSLALRHGWEWHLRKSTGEVPAQASAQAV
jgi:hypothetical protein